MKTPRIIKSLTYAARGLAKTWREEANFRIEALATLLVGVLAWCLGLDWQECAILALACGLVLALELVNTMIEQISDVLKPRLDQYVRHIKDISAAAVLVASLFAVIVGLCLFLPPLVRLFYWQG